MKQVYEVVQHDEGWAYKVGDVFSERFATHDEAKAAAEAAAERQHLAGETTDIEYEDARGDWHHELARGGDRPETEVIDGDRDGGQVLAEAEAEQDEASGIPSYSADVGADEPLPDGPRRPA